MKQPSKQTANQPLKQQKTTSLLDDNWQSDALDLSLNYDMQTMAVRAGQHRTDEGEHNEAIFATSSYVYTNAQEAANHFNGTSKGNVYSRHTNPSVRTFERRLAALEEGEAAIATASGMGAILTMCLAYLQAGDHVVAAKQLFGSTMGLLNNIMTNFGVKVDFVDGTNNQAWADAITQDTKLLFCESPSNPLTQICDIAYLADLAHGNLSTDCDALLVVDNCFATPAIQKPLTLGADIVIHSATKYLDGQGRVLGGALVGSHELMEKAFAVVRSGGITMSPFNAWVFTKGLETLNLRMQEHCRNANDIAQWLANHPKVVKVHFCGLPEHPSHQLAKQQHHKANCFGAIIGFEVANQQQAWQVIDSTKMISITNNLGDTKSTITHPATTTHFRMGEQARLEAGVKDGLIRLSVGIEDYNDIINDLAIGLDKL